MCINHSGGSLFIFTMAGATYRAHLIPEVLVYVNGWEEKIVYFIIIKSNQLILIEEKKLITSTKHNE